ncbi:LysR family transcriptional regulator [Primorskyibacter sp. S187A]|uniref:LysR family transcriptional regulator n=1 Tax=Primorskyibacter sp. S187A TaxID=3415130 RepID=UPI003C7CF7F5
MDDWDDLRIFLATARAETLSGAGRALRLDAATVGRRLARLEERLGQVLFLKSPRGYALSEAGMRLLPAAEQAEIAAHAAVEALGEPSEGLAGQVRIGAPDGCANYLLPQVCARLVAENPALELQILALPRVVNLSKREADLAITVSRPTGGRLMVQKICDYTLLLAGSRRYLAAHGPVQARADLRHHPMVGYIPDMIFDAELDYMRELGLGGVHFGSNSASVQLNLLRQDAGLGICHAFALPAAPEVVPVLTQDIRLTRSFHLLRHAEDHKRGRLTRLADRLVSLMRAEIARLESPFDLREN